MTPPIRHLAQYETIVFEGCDGAGKSTLARAAADAFGATLMHSALTPPGTDLVAAYTRLLDQRGRLVFDRCFLSELVYGPLYRGHSRLTYPQFAGLVRHVAARGGIFVHVTAPPLEIRRRLDERAGEEPPSLTAITDICRRYDELFTAVSTLTPVFKISTCHPNETR